MIWRIAKHEIISSVLSLKFGVSCLLCLVVALISSFVLVKDYEIRVEEYSALREMHNLEIEKTEAQVRSSAPQLPKDRRFEAVLEKSAVVLGGNPRPLSVLVQGVEGHFGLVAEIVPGPDVFNLGRSVGSHIPRLFPIADLAFLVRVAMSLFVLLLTYDLICGDKEQGTLRLLMVNPISCAEVLLGKLLGITLVIVAVSLLTFVSVLVPVALSSTISITGVIIGRMGMIFLVSFVYLLLFANLGLCCSTTNDSGKALITVLAAWFSVIAFLPNLGPIVARGVYPLPSKVVFDRQKAEFYQAQLPRYHMRLSAPEVNIELGKQEEAFYRQVRRHKVLARLIAYLSPASCYQYACESIAGTGDSQYHRFISALMRHREALFSYQEWLLKTSADSMESVTLTPPVFTFEHTNSLADDLSEALPGAELLLVFSVVCFLAAYKFFLKYELV